MSTVRGLPAARWAPALAALGVTSAAALWTLAAYLAGPGVALALVIAAAGAFVVLLRPVAGICAVVLSVPLEPLNLRLGVAGLSTAEVALLGTAGAILLEAARGRALWRGAGLAIAGWFAFAAVSALGVFVAQDATTVLKVAVMWSAAGLLALRVASAGAQEVRLVAAAIAASAVVLALLALGGAGDIELREGGDVVDNRATGSFNQPNLLAFYLVLALPLALVPAVRWSGLRRLPALAAAAAVLAGLLLTLSRGAILGAAAALLALCAWPGFRRFAAVVAAAIAAFAALNLGAIRESREITVLQTRLSSIAGERESNPRLRIYRLAPGMVLDHPVLGVGQGNFPRQAPFYNLRDRGGDVFDHAHNLPLTVAAETGIAGSAAFFVLVLGVVRAAARVVRSQSSPLFPYGIAATAALCGIAVVSLLDFPLRSNPVLVVIALQVGVLLAAARRTAS